MQNCNWLKTNLLIYRNLLKNVYCRLQKYAGSQRLNKIKWNNIQTNHVSSEIKFKLCVTCFFCVYKRFKSNVNELDFISKTT